MEHKTDEKIAKDFIYKNVRPSDHAANVKLIIYYKTKKTSQLLLRNRPSKTKTPLQEDHVVYQHTCNNEECGPHSYIGMTTTTLSRRLTCHLNNGSIKSHYASHHNNRLTREDLVKHTVILDKEQDSRRLLFLEAIYIMHKQPSINIQVDDLQILPSMKRHHITVRPTENSNPLPHPPPARM